jgi:hypothetical protein
MEINHSRSEQINKELIRKELAYVSHSIEKTKQVGAK